jgi:hypothetical protein
MIFIKTFKIVIPIILTSLIFSCNRSNSVSNQIKSDSTDIKPNDIELSKTISIKDTTVQFLWRDNKYDVELEDTFNTIFINEDYCKTISDPERAALGYIATFIGSECWWDGEPKEDRSNLKCKILTSLNLGYQCSDNHLGFLRQWFKNDTSSLEILQNCPTTPYTATVQETFNEIKLTIVDNKITIWFSASGINMRNQKSWDWSETDYFQFDKDNIKLINKDKSEVKYEQL